MRPSSASIRFYSREEDICNSTPIDWNDDDDVSGDMNDGPDKVPNSGVSSISSDRKLPKPSRPMSAPPSSQKHANGCNFPENKPSAPQSSFKLSATLLTLPPFGGSNTAATDDNSRLLDNLTRGYKGLITQDQLARCPTPRLDLFVPPPLISRGIPDDQQSNAGGRSCESVRAQRAAILAQGRSIAPTEKLRVSRKESFFTSAKQRELTSSTLTLAGFSVQDVDRIAAEVAAADAQAAANPRKTRKQGGLDRRRFATINPSDLSQRQLLIAAAAAVAVGTAVVDDATSAATAGDQNRNCAKWLGRTGAAAVAKLDIARVRMSQGLPPTDIIPRTPTMSLPSSAAAKLWREKPQVMSVGSGGNLLTGVSGKEEVDEMRLKAEKKILCYVDTLRRAHDIAAADQASKSFRGSLASMVSEMASIRHEIPKLQEEVESGQQLLIIWCTLACSAARIWQPAIAKLKELAQAWKMKQRSAVVLEAAVLRACARKYLIDMMILKKIGPRMIVRAKIVRKRVASRIVQTFLSESKSIYAAVKSIKTFRAKFIAARDMVMQHLDTKYYRIRWLLILWNKMERNRLMASRSEQIETIPQTIKWPLLLQTFVTLQAQFRSSISSWLHRHRNWKHNFSRQKMVDRFLATVQGRAHGSFGHLVQTKNYEWMIPQKEPGRPVFPFARAKAEIAAAEKMGLDCLSGKRTLQQMNIGDRAHSIMMLGPVQAMLKHDTEDTKAWQRQDNLRRKRSGIGK